ncbi:MAG: GerMN domain-containing protein [Treponema sp.]|jgi:hypothetical protein|nr:GerMN domain-containing protein [Treponema sp.]
MNGAIKDALRGIVLFFSKRQIRRLLYLGILAAAAVAEFLTAGLVRRTFVFYAVRDETPIVEDRMLVRGSSKEVDITRYVEELLLGPASLNAAPLFPRETALEALLYRDGVVYADLSRYAALPPPEGGDVFRSLASIDQGIRRNFPFVRDIRLFIDGNEVAFRGFLPKIEDT